MTYFSTRLAVVVTLLVLLAGRESNTQAREISPSSNVKIPSISKDAFDEERAGRNRRFTFLLKKSFYLDHHSKKPKKEEHVSHRCKRGVKQQGCGKVKTTSPIKKKLKAIWRPISGTLKKAGQWVKRKVGLANKQDRWVASYQRKSTIYPDLYLNLVVERDPKQSSLSKFILRMKPRRRTLFGKARPKKRIGFDVHLVRVKSQFIIENIANQQYWEGPVAKASIPYLSVAALEDISYKDINNNGHESFYRLQIISMGGGKAAQIDFIDFELRHTANGPLMHILPVTGKEVLW